MPFWQWLGSDHHHPTMVHAPPGQPPHEHAHRPHPAGALLGNVGALWARVEVKWVARHCHWGPASEHATLTQWVVEQQMTQLLVGQECTHQILVGIGVAVDCMATVQEQLAMTLGWQVAQQQLINKLLHQLLQQLPHWGHISGSCGSTHALENGSSPWSTGRACGLTE